ncbi:MAG: bifunctional (p)ppGpp synthetase/guanosine-3',5'-bis(diphosphate) 3'-pyrophosphohydrolase [Sulfuricella sp.]|nr:bifunctional (p)ppGpp synthetase/guanosine-3',5'-bis(diphosphate) 3'-pyrophosphohydrolase [Sulfuricella sp.]
MVTLATSNLHISSAGQTDWPSWLESLPGGFVGDDLALIRSACEYAEALYGNTPFLEQTTLLQHAIGAAVIVAGLRLDAGSVAATVLLAVPDLLDNTGEELEKRFGKDVAALVDGAARMKHIVKVGDVAAVQEEKAAQLQIESLRKMLLAMVEDIRVVLIKLAERTHALRRAAKADEETRRAVAREIQDVYAPLANRLGVWQIKWEMEDLSFRFLETELYKKIAKLLDEKRLDRESYIAAVLDQLSNELAQAGVKAEVTGRPKHIYSIYKKMKRKKVEFGDVYDVRAVRVLVESVGDCYTALGIVHNLWQPIPKEFDDYISHPKGNDYRSLHTAVIGPEDKALEVQIRTQDMHRHAELGVAAHWRYKEGGKGDARFEEKIAWLRQILEWKDDVQDAGEILDQFKTGLFQDTIYVLTPQGKVIALPAGSTPIDFAYHLHTDLGHRCRGAKIDGSIVPLNTKLANGQRVEIITVKQGGPSRDWLSASQGYVASGRARAKIRYWFKYQHFEENLAQGREALEKEAHRLGLVLPSLEKFIQKFGFDSSEDFLAAIGRGDLSARQAVAAMQEPAPVRADEPEWQPGRHVQAKLPSSILVEDVGNLLTVMAKCCKPLPPDPIVGFVTRGRGVAIHRHDCPNVKRLDEAGMTRLLAAEWGVKPGLYEVDIEVEASDRQGLLRDISETLTREKVNVTAASTLSRGQRAAMGFTLQIGDVAQLDKVLGKVREVPGVSGARRK